MRDWWPRMMRTRRTTRWPVAAVGLMVAGGVAGGCGGAAVDVEAALTVSEVTTGWIETGAGADHKIVPVISFRLENGSDAGLGVMQVNGVFHRSGESEAWGSALVRAVGREGLAPGAVAGPFTLQSERGYTGRQPGAELLAHGEFVDVGVDLFVKHRSAEWVRLVTFEVDHRMLAGRPVG